MQKFIEYIQLKEGREGSIPNTIKKKAQEFLHKLGTQYHKSIPVTEIQDTLKILGITFAEPEFILTGRDGRDTFELLFSGIPVNSNLVMSWHKMNSGNWEITTYLS